MQDQLISLCELQLQSLLEEIDDAVISASHSATAGLKLCSTLDELDTGEEVQDALKAELANILRRLQFHDELSQRISHLKELLVMMKGETENNRLRKMNPGQLLDQVKGIFSVKAEFVQLHKIFPHYNEQENGEAIELF